MEVSSKQKRDKNSAETEVILQLLLALSFSGSFYNTEANRAVREYIKGGFDAQAMKRLAATVSGQAWEAAERELDLAAVHSVDVVSVFDPQYPLPLSEIADPPLVLFSRGRLKLDRPFAVVGTRGASSYGLDCAASLAFELARAGVTVVSGLALGVDCAAHEGALQAARTTGAYPGIAVLGSGAAAPTPKSNVKVARGLLEAGGALVSEYGVLTQAMPHFFPRRNRIISGLSRGVVVVEAPEKSGAMITARFALEQGRDVFTVPCRIDSASGTGNNALLKNGAAVAISAQDILDAYVGWAQEKSGKKRAERAYSVNPEELASSFPDPLDRSLCEKIIRVIAQETQCNVEALAADIGCSYDGLRVLLGRMEVAGFLAFSAGDCVRLARKV